MCELLGISLLSMFVYLSFYFSLSTFRIHTNTYTAVTPNCNILQIEILRVWILCTSQTHIHTRRPMYIYAPSLSAQFERSLRFSCCATATSCLVLFSTWYILYGLILSALCHRCIWVIICSRSLLPIGVCVYEKKKTFSSVYMLTAKPKSRKKPISFWICISYT